MDRWRIAENQPRVFRDETTDKHYVASNHFQADRIVTVLDAYEARIAELEEERDAAVEFAHSAEQAFCAVNATLDQLMATTPAASPWRFDVENAPANEWLLVQYSAGWCKGTRDNTGEWADEDGMTIHPVRAFATINPPEVQG